METTFIYGLCCPITNNIRYIGKSDNPMYRLRKHKEESIRGVSTHKCNWIRCLLKQGHSPVLEIIDEVPKEQWIFWERHYISLYRSWCFNLINETFGGDGIPIMTQEIKEKISKKNKGRTSIWLGKKHNTETRLKMSQKRLGYKMTEQAKRKISDFVSHPIFQLTKSGEFIREWKSAELAQKELKIYHIRCAINGKDTRQYAGGFLWKNKPANKIFPDSIKL